jgi:flagellar motility protein MotE (MotC chaperone)
MRDEKAHQLRKQQREIQNKNKTLASQNNMMAKVHTLDKHTTLLFSRAGSLPQKIAFCMSLFSFG